MTTIGEAFIKVRPDMDGFDQEAEAGIGSRLGGLAAAGTAALAGVAVAAGAFGAKAVMAASDLGESISKVNVVFGESADAVLAWGASTEGTLLLSKQQALEAAGTFGNLFTSFGISGDAAAGMSQDMVMLAQDLASFNNIPVEEALDAIRSGLTGETEPLKRLGASFNAAELEAKALSMGLMEQGGEMSNAAKAQAGMALILERTSNAQGDAARTAGGLANQMKILKADSMDMLAGVGEALMPVATELVGTLGGAIQEVAPMLADMAGAIVPILGTVLEQIGPLLTRLGPPLQKVFDTIATVMEAVPWDMVVMAVGNIGDAVATLMPPLQAALVPILKVIGTLLPPISALFGVVAEVLAAVLMPVIEAIAPVLVELATMLDSQLNDVLETLVPLLADMAAQIGGALGTALAALLPAVMQIIEAFLPLLPVLMELVETLLPPLVELLLAVLPVVTTLAEIIATVLAAAIEVLVSWISDYLVPAFQSIVLWVTDKVLPIVESLGKMFGTVKEWIAEHIGAIVGFVTGIPGRIAATVSGLWEGLKSGITGAKDWVGEKIGEVVGFITGLPGKVLESIADWASAGLDLGGDFLDGLKDGLTAAVGFAGDVAAGIVRVIKDAWNTVAGTINDFVPNSIGWGMFSLDLPDNPIPTFHTGGKVPGGYGEEVPALLMAGETVRTRQQEDSLQRNLSGGGARGAGGVNFHGPVTFGADMQTARAELEWMAKYAMGVAA